MIFSQVALVCLAALVLGKKPNSDPSVSNCGDECPDNCICACNQTTTECTDGCVAGYYGYSCNTTCAPRCKTQKCLQNGGYCVCELGYLYSNSRCEKDAGKQCRTHRGCRNDNCSSTGDEKCIEGCKPGLFGTTCESPCEDNCFCDQESGKCTDCVPGWFGPECQSQCSSGCTEGCYKNGSCIDGCKPGSYGEQCKSTCPPQCGGGLCDRNGACVTCKTGFSGPQCIKAEDGTDWMPYIIGGGVLLIVVVLAVCMVCCLKRMQGIVDNGMKSIGEKSVVNFELGRSASVYSMNNSRVCGSNYATVEATYDHLFDVKPISKYSSFDDLETASGYCSVLLQERVVINDGNDTKSATSLADVMFDEVEACGGVQQEEGGAQKTCEIIFLQSQEDEKGVLRDEGGNDNASDVRDMEVVDLSRSTNVEAAHASNGDWAGGKSGIQFKEDTKIENYHTQDGDDLDENKGSKLTDEEEASRITREQGYQDEVKKLSMVC